EILKERERHTSRQAHLRQQEEEAEMLWNESRRGRDRRRRGYSSSHVRYDTLSPPPTRWDHTLSPPHDRRTRYDDTLSPPRDRITRYDDTLSPPRDHRTRCD
ncbi:unnamed protein product, partial [Pylaiella littoralis]